jgi:hypothetical protein
VDSTEVMDLMELRRRAERLSGSPQRLSLVGTYLDSLTYGTNGLSQMGLRMGFVILLPEPPMTYPKMMYHGGETSIAADADEEAALIAGGFSPEHPYAPERKPAAATKAPPVAPPTPPTVTVTATANKTTTVTRGTR